MDTPYIPIDRDIHDQLLAHATSSAVRHHLFTDFHGINYPKI